MLMLSLLIGGSACFTLSRSAPPVQRFVVGSASVGPTLAPATNAPAVSLGLRRLDLAPYLSTLEIVVRRADNQLLTTGFHRWGEHPSTGLNRAVAGYLLRAPAVRSVDVAPWPLRAQHDYLIQLHISRFEGIDPRREGGGEAQLLAHWEIIHPRDGSLAARGRTEYRDRNWRIGDYGGLVRRLDEGLMRLAQELLDCVSQLGPPPSDTPRDSSDGLQRRPSVLECSAGRVP